MGKHNRCRSCRDCRDSDDSMPISSAVRRMVDDSGKPLRHLAAEVGKGATTFYRELDESDSGAKIGVDTLPLLIRACCGDSPEEPPLPLVVLAHRCGFRLVPCDAEPDKDDVRDECLDDARRLVAFHTLVREGRIPPDALDAVADGLCGEIQETAAAYRLTKAGKMPAGEK